MNMANVIAMNATILVNNDVGNSIIMDTNAINATVPITLNTKNVKNSNAIRTILLMKKPAI